jgi:hypothetical protein
LAEGHTNREIADRLHLSPHTIKNYLFRIFDKLGVSSRVELLFMTLSQSSPQLPSRRDLAAARENVEYSPHETEVIRRSAEAGLPAAQLALARLHLARRGDPQAPVEAYKWYLLATRGSAEIFTNMLTPQQVQDAEQRASSWTPSPNKKSSPSNQVRHGSAPRGSDEPARGGRSFFELDDSALAARGESLDAGTRKS